VSDTPCVLFRVSDMEESFPRTLSVPRTSSEELETLWEMFPHLPTNLE